MKPQEAIKEIQKEIPPIPANEWSYNTQAHQLGIEALEFRLRWEQQEGEKDFPLLPGETKE